MLPDDVTMATLWSDLQSLTDEEAETRRVEHRATPNDPVPGQPTQLPGNVCQNVHCRQPVYFNQFDAYIYLAQ